MKAQIFLAGLALVVVSSFATAQNQGSKRGSGNGTCTGKSTSCSAFVDANNNGICDTYESGSSASTQAGGKTQGKGQGNGTGTCDGTGGQKRGQKQGNCKGVGFVDLNQNGICDTFEALKSK
jgi:hypothetical protein